ncbi:MAG: TonB family protein [Pseudorhodoferax sp.]
MNFRFRLALCAAALSLLGACATGSPERVWPARLVGIDQMRPTQRIQTSLLVHRQSNSPAATVVLRLHVDETGQVLQSEVVQSSALPRVDGAALGAMRKMRFVPYVEGGVAVPVTVIAPMHFPAVN